MASSSEEAVDEIRAFRATDEPAVRELLDATFGQRVDTTWRERPTDGPDVSPLVLERDGAIKAFVRLDAVPTWVERERLWLILGGDLVIAPELRGGKAYNKIQRAVVKACLVAGASGLIAFPRDHVATLFKRRRDDDIVAELGRIPQWVHWASIRAVERSGDRELAGPKRAAIGALAKATGLAVRVSSRLDETLPAPEELDALAARSAAWALAIRERNHRHFRERWLERAHRWNVRAVRRRGQLTGVVVFGVRSWKGVPFGRIVDVLAEDLFSFRALIAGATRELRAIGCEMVLLELADSRRWVGPVLQSCGFLERGIGPVMIVAGSLDPRLNQMENWYLTLGDTDLG